MITSVCYWMFTVGDVVLYRCCITDYVSTNKGNIKTAEQLVEALQKNAPANTLTYGVHFDPVKMKVIQQLGYAACTPVPGSQQIRRVVYPEDGTAPLQLYRFGGEVEGRPATISRAFIAAESLEAILTPVEGRQSITGSYLATDKNTNVRAAITKTYLPSYKISQEDMPAAMKEATASKESSTQKQKYLTDVVHVLATGTNDHIRTFDFGKNIGVRSLCALCQGSFPVTALEHHVCSKGELPVLKTAAEAANRYALKSQDRTVVYSDKPVSVDMAGLLMSTVDEDAWQGHLTCLHVLANRSSGGCHG
jgi:hypothetical protein